MRRFLREISIGLRAETITALDAAAEQLRRSGQRNASRSGLVRRIVERAIQDAQEGKNAQR